MEHRTFQGFIIGLIEVNAIMIGLVLRVLRVLRLLRLLSTVALEHQKEAVAAPSAVEQRLLDEIVALRDEVRALSRPDAAR